MKNLPLQGTGIQKEESQAKQHSAVNQTDCSGDSEVSSSSSHFDSGIFTSNIDCTNNCPKSPLSTTVLATIPTTTAAGDGVRDTPVNINISSTNSSNKPTKAHVRRWIAKQEYLRQKSLKENRPYETVLQEYYIRRQKRLEKNKPKEVEEFLQSEPVKGEGKHFLEVRLIRTTAPFTDKNYESALKLSHKIYEQYQIDIHKGDINDCNWEHFKRVLIKSPLVLDNPEWNSASPMFGTYHQQYWLDGEKIIAVGVIDILPKCLSSVYVFYDPQYAFLHLGTYTALREIAFVRQLARTSTINNDSMYSNFKSYYMGYYIHSCRKMSYKAQYTPAYLACPETYNWLPIAECLKALDTSPNGKYARFSDISAVDHNAIPKGIDMDTLDSQIYFCIVYINDNENDSGDGGEDNANSNSLRSPPISLKALRSRLNRRAIPVFREWAKLLGNRVLSGHFQIIIHSQ
ncbi:unnamed protein product [Trichobilharzia szidati]|nr:unnamed protein product [Trichobilharzia szidati]